ncbi:MAG: hypothetical protein C0615_09905 [Desulfuromonas sp.]|nr:MAG: hypothetical protein C0615_09905 [Desulfuromonas sp.]
MVQYEESIDEKRRIITVRVSGRLAKDTWVPNTIKFRTWAKENGYGILYDFRNAENCLSILDGHTWVEDNLDPVDPWLRYVPTVHLAKEEDSEFFHFVETSWTNAGIPVHMATEEREGLEWIAGKLSHYSKLNH